MSQKDDSESDIWEYKPLGKKKKTKDTVTKRRCTVRKLSKRDTSTPVKSLHQASKSGDCSTVVNGPDVSDLKAHNAASQSSPTSTTSQTHNAGEESFSGDFCPVCQMPFSTLVVQTHRWHVAECLETSRDACEECPDGLKCLSILPNHFKKFNHTSLAYSRANGDTGPLSRAHQAETSSKTSPVLGLINNEVHDSILESSQESAFSVSVLSNHSISPHRNPTVTPPSKLTNGLLLLRSPGPEDFKKKKGWSSSKSPRLKSSSQKSRTKLSSTPVKTESGRKAREDSTNRDPSPDIDAISYSPLSEFPAETEGKRGECRKALFNNDLSENENENSMVLFSDGFSSEDELLAEFMDTFETNNVKVKEEPASLNSQLDSVTTNQPFASTVGADSTGGREAHGQSASAISTCKSSIQSPQSIVLERLRETLLSSDSQCLNDSSIPGPSSQTSVVQKAETMPPNKGQAKAGQASCLKQTDIGVFFGLKPLKEKEKAAEIGPSELSTTSVPTFGKTSGQRQQRRERQRKTMADTTADTSKGAVAVDNCDAADAQGNAGKSGTRGWRGRRWNRRNADGEVQLPRCPFYKKIPGTKFAIDAFQYGEIPGITAYFLTHFHSDHYGGLTKNSTLPIYCNKITGNLVKSKLKVAEQFVHILPMNTQVTVEGVSVILLDANHCPGAAMLLFILPDGQTVLHTGDFRADPSMETYPELLSCRVQTLYLDTTYCSPEYTFPRQQEVINYAANTVFELVTLKPRTLVVCGSYSVGKEKVFLALAEVLGSKVCLTRDKYNTMCCLESEEIKQSITTDRKAAQVHVLPMMQLSFKKLQDYLARFSKQYDHLVAFKPTGWTFSQQVESVEDIQPQTSGNISIYGIPYSEHSSFLELKRFVQWLQPLKIIPTVNNGSWASRKAMESCFSAWIMEAKAKL